MSRGFNGSSEYLTKASTPVALYPLTFAGWLNAINASGTLTVVGVGASGTTAQLSFLHMNNGGLRLYTRDNAANPIDCSGGTSILAGAWYHVAGTVNAAGTFSEVFLNGVSDATAGGTLGAMTLNQSGIGVLDVGGSQLGLFNGSLAEIGIWNVALSLDEIKQLAAGFSCALVRPSALVSHTPLVRELNDLKGPVWTATGTTVTDHPRIFYPRRRQPFGVAAAGGGTTVALTGVSGTGVVGSLAPAVSAALTGNAGTGVVGSVAPSASIALTGNAGAGVVGSVAPSVTIALTGVAGTGVVGTLTPATGVVVALTGVSGTGVVGSLAASVSVPLTGNAGTGAIGTLTPVSGVIVALTGVSGTGVVGSLAPAVSIALTGVSADGAVGTLTVDGATSAIDPGAKKTRGRAKRKRIEDEQRIEREYLESLKPTPPVAKKRAAPTLKAETAVDVVKPAPSAAKAPAVAQVPVAAVAAPVERDLAAEVDFKMQYWSRFLVLVIDNLHSH